MIATHTTNRNLNAMSQLLHVEGSHTKATKEFASGEVNKTYTNYAINIIEF